jgi:hypothetical protein
MRLLSTVVAGICFSALLMGRVRGDDLKINTPVVSANLSGNWELQPEEAAAYKQTLHLGPQFTGEWQRSRETLPVSIAWFVEGGELRILYYYEPAGALNYRVKTLMVPYKLADDILTLTFDGKPSTWKRTKVAATAKP